MTGLSLLALHSIGKSTEQPGSEILVSEVENNIDIQVNICILLCCQRVGESGTKGYLFFNANVG